MIQIKSLFAGHRFVAEYQCDIQNYKKYIKTRGGAKIRNIKDN